MHNVGIVLHPQRDSAEAVDAILRWAEQRSIGVLGIVSEISRLRCAAVGVTPEELGRRSDLIVSLGGDGTMLRAMRLADRQRAPVEPAARNPRPQQVREFTGGREQRRVDVVPQRNARSREFAA